MTLIAVFGGIESGLIYALVALGVLISFRILDFPDLTTDGSFPLGAAIFAVCVTNGINPWLACLAGAAGGAAAGMVTAWLHVSLKILQLLSSILVMVALYSINLRVMDAPMIPLNGEPSVFSPFRRLTWVWPLASVFRWLTPRSCTACRLKLGCCCWPTSSGQWPTIPNMPWSTAKMT